MIKGLIRVVDDEGMNRIHQAALQVLETTGLIIRGRFLLEALADAGCRVDFEQQRAWFRPDLIVRQMEAQRNRYRMVRSSLWYPFCRALPEADAAWPDEFWLITALPRSRSTTTRRAGIGRPRCRIRLI
jgi:hypothetical protein